MGTRHLMIGLTGMNAVLLMAQLAQQHSASAAGPPETVRARAIEVVDERGRIRAQLNVEADGEAVFRLRDSEGEIRVKLGAGRNGSGLLLLDASTEPGVQMLASNEGPRVTLTGKGGKRRIISP